MRAPLLFGFVLGLWAAACSEPEEDLGTFPCGDEECDVRSEICSFDEPCDSSPAPPPACTPVPDACDGTASAECLDAAGCIQGEEGGFSCSPLCG